MIIGIGSDIIEVRGMKRELTKSDNGIRDDVFTEHEINYCSNKRYPERHFAARFAAKEAVFKSLMVGKIPEFRWHDIEVHNDINGKPYLIFSGNVQTRINGLSVRNTFVTMSHTSFSAMATVILES